MSSKKGQRSTFRVSEVWIWLGVYYDAKEYTLLAINTVPIVPAVQSLRSVQAVTVIASGSPAKGLFIPELFVFVPGGLPCFENSRNVEVISDYFLRPSRRRSSLEQIAPSFFVRDRERSVDSQELAVCAFNKLFRHVLLPVLRLRAPIYIWKDGKVVGAGHDIAFSHLQELQRNCVTR